jgi:cell division protein FtsB
LIALTRHGRQPCETACWRSAIAIIYFTPAKAGKDIFMEKRVLKEQMAKVHEKFEALPARFTLQSGRVFTYCVERRCMEDTRLRINHVPQEGKCWNNFSGMILTADGNWKYFGFHSFSGESDEGAARAREYALDCAELLSAEFAAKIMADYNAKAKEFEALHEKYTNISQQINEIERKGDKKE